LIFRPLMSAVFPYTTLFRSRQLAGTGLVAAGRVGDLHVRDTVAVVRDGGLDVVAVDGEVVDVEQQPDVGGTVLARDPVEDRDRRSEEHTSELQSRENLVCRL